MNFSADNFKEEVINSSIPVVVDFWAPWCRPCNALTPLIEKLATEYDGKVKIGKVNIDENYNIAAEYSVDAIPAIYFFKNGTMSKVLKGLQTEAVLREQIDLLLD